jgi:hypothetical protein
MNWVIWMKKVWFFHFLTLYTNEKIYFDEKKATPFRSHFRGVRNIEFFLFRLSKIYA